MLLVATVLDNAVLGYSAFNFGYQNITVKLHYNKQWQGTVKPVYFGTPK